MIKIILAGMIFSATVIIAALELPVPKKYLSKPIFRTVSSVIFTAADSFLLLTFRKGINNDLAGLIGELTDNKKAAEEFFPPFLKGAVGSIHGALISAAEFLDNIAGAVTGFFESGAETAAFLTAVFAVSAAAVFLAVKYGKKDSSEDIVGIWRSIGYIIKNEFADAFFIAPVGAVIIYLLITLFSVPFGTVLCSLLWILSFIPFIGTAVSVITGTLILLLSAHPVNAAVFLLMTSAVFAALNIGKEILAQKWNK